MNILDILIAIPLLYFVYKGWSRGLAFEIASLAGVIAGAYAAVHFSQWVADMLGLDGENAILTAFFITFVGVVALAFLLGKAVEGALKMTHLSIVNRLVGALFGMLKCLCILSVVLSWIVMIDRHEMVLTSKTKNESLFYEPTQKVGGMLTARLRKVVDEYRSKAATQDENTSPFKK